MNQGSHINELTATVAGPQDRKSGLLAWLRFRLDDLVVIDGVSLRRTRDGRLVLSFPIRHDSQGRQHPIVRPVDDVARRALESEVLEALGLNPGQSCDPLL